MSKIIKFKKDGEAPALTDPDKKAFRDRMQKHLEALKSTLRPWLDKSRDTALYHDKIVAMLELGFEYYLSFCDEAEALEMIELQFHGYVKRRHGTVQ